MNLFNVFLEYRLTGKEIFGKQSRIEERRKPKKVKNDHHGWVFWSGGTLRNQSTGRIRGKAAIKAAKKLTHQRRYYACTQ